MCDIFTYTHRGPFLGQAVFPFPDHRDTRAPLSGQEEMRHQRRVDVPTTQSLTHSPTHTCPFISSALTTGARCNHLHQRNRGIHDHPHHSQAPQADACSVQLSVCSRLRRRRRRRCRRKGARPRTETETFDYLAHFHCDVLLKATDSLACVDFPVCFICFYLL